MGKRKATVDIKSSASTENLNEEICGMLLELAEFEKNVNRQRFKYQAYRKAATALSKHPTKIKSGAEAQNLDGVGKKIADKIDEFLKSGHIKKVDKVRSDETAVSLAELMQVSGIGPVQARKLYDEGIKTIEELKKHPDKLNHHQKIGLRYHKEFLMRIPRDEMDKHEKMVQKYLSELDPKYTGIFCGSYRRGLPSSGDMDILLTHEDYLTSADKSKSKDALSRVVEKFKLENYVTDVISLGESKFMGVCVLKQTVIDDQGNEAKKLKENDHQEPAQILHRRIDIRIIPKSEYWCCVLYFTGSDEFNRNMRQKANELGFTISEYSIRKLSSTGKPGDPLPVSSEKDVFDYIDMKYVEPKDRNH